jgi:hypothetical protein
VRTVTGKEPLYRLADSGGGAGDQCYPVLQHGHMITRGRARREAWFLRARLRCYTDCLGSCGAA